MLPTAARRWNHHNGDTNAPFRFQSTSLSKARIEFLILLQCGSNLTMPLIHDVVLLSENPREAEAGIDS